MQSDHYHPTAGIHLQHLTPKECRVVYDGLLAKSGAEHIYMRTGVEKANGWGNIYDYKMERIGDGFEAKVEMEAGDIQFCFKDCAGNWDNNNGQNWSVKEF